MYTTNVRSQTQVCKEDARWKGTVMDVEEKGKKNAVSIYRVVRLNAMTPQMGPSSNV
jgi:hypothetical protein